MTEITTGAELKHWREFHAIPRRALAQAVGYASANAITMIELYRDHLPQHVREYVATYTPPPPLSGSDLRTWRHAHGLRSIDVGRRFGCQANTVRMWELGYRRVPWHVRAMIHGCPMPPGEPRRGVPCMPTVSEVEATRQARRQAILAAIRDEARTLGEIKARLPMRLHYDTIRRHLYALRAAGDVVRWEPRPQLVLWRSTLAAQRRGVGS